MKKELPMPVVAGVIVVVILTISIFTWRAVNPTRGNYPQIKLMRGGAPPNQALRTSIPLPR